MTFQPAERPMIWHQSAASAAGGLQLPEDIQFWATVLGPETRMLMTAEGEAAHTGLEAFVYLEAHQF